MISKAEGKLNKWEQQLNIVLQREYIIIEPKDEHPILATESVRGCCAIMIYHPTRSAILHWDDNVCHSELNRFVTEYLGSNLKLDNTIKVVLVGGWKDKPQSVASTQFLKQYFEQTGVQLNTNNLLKKEFSANTYNLQGFSLVALDSRTGEFTTSSDWSKEIDFKDAKFRRQNLQDRLDNLDLRMHLDIQNDNYPDSGFRIIARDQFSTLQETQSLQMCIAARDNKIDDLIKCFDTAITDVNFSPSSSKGWTPLHYAIKLGNFDAARLIIANGGDLYKKNAAQITPAMMLNAHSPINKRRVLAFFNLVQYNKSLSPNLLATFSIFSRHPERLTNETDKQNMANLLETLKTEAGIIQIESILNSK